MLYNSRQRPPRTGEMRGLMKPFPAYKTFSVQKLVPYARNSRTHSPQQIDKIAASIKEFGFLNPIIVDGDNGIIAGHGRVMAAQKLGLAEVPVIEAAHLTEAQKRAFNWWQMQNTTKSKQPSDVRLQDA